MVILLSDATDMEGGELLVAQLSDDPRESLRLIRSGEIDRALVDTVRYPGPGFAIFMQGSRIAHSVTPVLRAREPRLTVVNSYSSLNPFSPDRTVFSTFLSIEGAEITPFEFARHVAWRVQGQLEYLKRANLFGGKEQARALERLLEHAAAELARAKALIAGDVQDERPYDVDGDFAQQADRAIAEDRRSKL